MPEQDPLTISQELERRRQARQRIRNRILANLRKQRGITPEPVLADRSSIENFVRGAATGLSQTATSLAGLPGLFIPGPDPFERFAERAGEKVEDFFDAQGRAGRAGRVTGRIVGEASTALLGGGAVIKGVGTLARAGRGGKALKAVEAARVGERGRLAQATARTVPFAPIDLAIGAARGQREGTDPLRTGLREVAVGQIAGGVFNIAGSFIGQAGKALQEELLKRSEGFANLFPRGRLFRDKFLAGESVRLKDLTPEKLGLLPATTTLWKAGLLSNPKTQILNVTSNFMFQSIEAARKAPTAFFDMLLKTAVSGTRSRAFPTLGEVFTPVTVLLRGGRVKALEGTAALKRNVTLKEALTGPIGASDVLAKSDLSKRFATGTASTGNDFLDMYANTMFKLLGGVDAAFRGASMEGTLRNLLRLEGTKRGLRGTTLSGFVGKHMRPGGLAEVPPNWLQHAIDIAEKDARKVVFQDETAFGAALNKLVEKAPALEFIFPFRRTPAAIAQRVLEYTPAGFLMAIPRVFAVRKGAIAALRTTGKKSRREFGKMIENQREAVDLLGRATTGSFGLIGIGWWLAEHGLAIGDAPQPGTRERQTFDAAGMQSHSIRFPDGNWHRIANLAPGGNLIAMGAQIHQIVTEGTEQGKPRLDDPRSLVNMIAASATTGIRAFAEQPFFTGMREVVALFTQPLDQGARSVEDLLASLVPAGVAALTRSLDSSIREDDGIAQTFINRLPFLSRALPVRVNAFGEDIVRIPGILANMIDPTTPRKATDNPIIRELARVRAGVPKVARRKEPDGQLEDIEVFQQRQRWFGQIALNAAWNVMESEVYKRADHMAQVATLKFQELKTRGVPEEIVRDALGLNEAKLIDDWAKGRLDGDSVRRMLLEWAIDTARRQVGEFID